MNQSTSDSHLIVLQDGESDPTFNSQPIYRPSQSKLRKAEEIEESEEEKIIHKKRNKEKTREKLDENFQFEEDVEDDFKLSPKAKKWAIDMNDTGKFHFFSILSEIEKAKIPTKDGGKGITISRQVRTSDIRPFLNQFMKKKRKFFKVKTSHKRYPFTGGTYTQCVWVINSYKDLDENLFCMFENVSIIPEILWIHHPIQMSINRRINNPRSNEDISFFYQDNQNARDKIRNYNMENFGTETSLTKQVNMVVGEIPSGKIRVGSFRITFTRNWHNGEKYFGGDLSFRFFHEVSEGGFLKGERAQDDEYQEVAVPITDEEAFSEIHKKKN